jgi:hypothetical protein
MVSGFISYGHGLADGHSNKRGQLIQNIHTVSACYYYNAFGRFFLPFIRKNWPVHFSLEYVVMDLKGNIIKRIYLPRVDNVPFMSKIIGAKLHTIYNDKFYYLLENEDEKKWELYVEEIK